ncbi:MAG TPA: MarR family transcriptional regulator [Candidatus Thermoplasmatota archaeon]|nr:MarR family transcriptional regulator [Candidatus Thermoplasmatota archaeon]
MGPDTSRAASLAVDTGLGFLCYLKAELRSRRPGDLSIPQFRFLSILAKETDRSLGDIAEDLGVSPPALSKLVDGLVERSLVARAADASDRRRLSLAITPAGQRLVAGFRAQLEEGLAQRLAALPARSQASLAAALADLQTVLAPEVPA